MTIRYKRPDTKNALSLIEASEREMKFTLSLKITEASGSTIIKNIYECFRMLGDALLVKKGIKSTDHVSQIKELMRLQISTPRPLALLGNYRLLRHNLNYYAYKPIIQEVEDIVDFAKKCFAASLKAVSKEIRK